MSNYSRAFLLLFPIFCGCGKAKEFDAPRNGLVVLGNINRDLGRLDEGTMASTVFHLRNDTGREVCLSPNVETSCGCTAGQLSQTKLAPGERMELKLGLSVGRSGNSAQIQRVQAKVHVLYDSEIPDVVVGVQFAAIPRWSVSPSNLVLNGLPGSTQKLRFSICGDEARNTRLTSLTTSYEGCELPEFHSSESENAKIDIVCDVVVPKQSMDFRIAVTTNDAAIPTKYVSVAIKVSSFVRVVPPIVRLPRPIELGNVDEVKVADMTVLVPNPGFVIDASGLEGISFSVKQSATNAGSFDLMARVSKGGIRGLLKIRSEDGSMEKDVPVLVGSE